MGALKKIGLIFITLFVPPIGVFLVAGCGIDLLINILLTILGYLPGHIHAFYIEYVYFQRRQDARAGVYTERPAPGVYSSKVQRGGLRKQSVPPPVEPAPGHAEGPAPVVQGGPPPQQPAP